MHTPSTHVAFLSESHGSMKHDPTWRQPSRALGRCSSQWDQLRCSTLTAQPHCLVLSHATALCVHAASQAPPSFGQMCCHGDNQVHHQMWIASASGAPSSPQQGCWPRRELVWTHMPMHMSRQAAMCMSIHMPTQTSTARTGSSGGEVG